MGEYVITEGGSICRDCLASTSGHCPKHPDIQFYPIGPLITIQADLEFQSGQADGLLLAFADYILCPDKRTAYARRMRAHLRELVALLPPSALAKLRAEIEDVLPMTEDKAEGGDSWRSMEQHADLVGRTAHEP